MPAREVTAHVYHPAPALDDASPCQLALLAAHLAWHHSCPFFRAEMGLADIAGAVVDRDWYFVEEEEIPFLRRRGKMRFYAIKLPKFLSGVVKAVARLFTRQRTSSK